MVIGKSLSFTDFLQVVNAGTNIDVSGATFSSDDAHFSTDGSSIGIAGRPFSVINGELTKGQVIIPGNQAPQITDNGVVR